MCSNNLTYEKADINIVNSLAHFTVDEGKTLSQRDVIIEEQDVIANQCPYSDGCHCVPMQTSGYNVDYSLNEISCLQYQHNTFIHEFKAILKFQNVTFQNLNYHVANII